MWNSLAYVRHMWALTGNRVWPLSRLPLATYRSTCVLGVLSFVRFPGKSNENNLVLVPSHCVCTFAVFRQGSVRRSLSLWGLGRGA